MRTLGIDPGTAIMGWGIVEPGAGGNLAAVAYGVITTPKELSLPQRLQLLQRGLQTLLEQYRPETAGIEELFFSRNVTNALAVGHARGVALLTLANANIDIHEYRPIEVKQALVGYGRADKRQIQEMVRLTLGLDHLPRPDDAADALAVAICHAYTGPTRALIDQQMRST